LFNPLNDSSKAPTEPPFARAVVRARSTRISEDFASDRLDRFVRRDFA